jgi:glycosyltransferase involved in cell wall biosynthesis
MKLSFVIAVHNEEKIIAQTLKNLLSIPYDDYEVILGLDGCTDRTQDIVNHYCEKSDKINYLILNPRQGKTAVINEIVKLAEGEIIIIMDADWIFHVESGQSMEKLVALFNNPEVGGIAESFPVQYPLRKEAGMLERGVMWQNKFWMDYAKKFKLPLLVNILRRSLFRNNTSLADDFERYNDIIKFGYKVIVSDDENLPRMITGGEDYTFSGIVRQKERTAVARKQVALEFDWKFYLYAFFRMFTLKPKDFLAILIVNIAFMFGTLKSKDVSTSEGWGLRAR